MSHLSDRFANRILSSGARGMVLKNILYLLVTQIVNYILSLITIKYLLMTIGVSNFGKIAFVQAFLSYFIVFIDYGFSISATRDIARCHKDDRIAISRIFASTMAAKFILLIAGLLVYAGLVLLIPKFSANKLTFLLFSGVLIGTCLFPQWYFQGIQKMEYITWINILIKAVLLLLVFLFVKQGSDYVFVPLIYSLSYVLFGVYALLLALKHCSFRGNYDQHTVLTAFRGGFPLFLSSAVSILLNGSSIFILGLIVADDVVGYYAGYDKLIRSCLMIFTPITTAIYPHVSETITENFSAGVKLIKKAAAFTLLLAMCLIIFLIALSDYIIPLIFTEAFLRFRGVLVILAAWMVFNVANNFIGIQYYTSIGKSKVYAQSLTVSGIITLGLMIYLTRLQSCYGTAVSILIGEVLLTAILLLRINSLYDD